MAVIKARRTESYTPSDEDKDERLRAVYKKAAELTIKTLPLDIESFIRSQGILIHKEDMDSDISGYLEKRGNDWIIGINKYHAPRRQRFTLAHEYAHFILHKEHIEKEKKHFDTILFRGKENDELEKQANELSANILMPKGLFEQFLRLGIRSLSDLADRFNVSPAAIRYRAYKLGFIKEY